MRLSWIGSSSLLAVFASSFLLPLAMAKSPQLVVFAGPHKTSETSIEEFFFSYAHGPASASANLPRQQALKHWVWPQIQSAALHRLHVTAHQVFGHLVLSPDNAEIQKAILNGIKTAWTNSMTRDEEFQGMIIGSPEFDRVGPNPYANVDAVDAVQRVVSTLRLKPKDVTIILLYRIPRMDQWLGVFNFVPIELKNDGTDDPYQQFLCDPEYARDFAWDFVSHAMNPLRVATTYAQAGYKVQLLDMSGIQALGLDVEHVIGCDILNGFCDGDGYLMNLRDKSYLKDSETNDGMSKEGVMYFPDLTHSQLSEIEQLFRLRDCAYKSSVKNDTFIELDFPRDMLDMECSESNIAMANMLAETDYFLNVLQSQVGCNGEPVSIEQILDGTAEAPDMSNFNTNWATAAPVPTNDAHGDIDLVDSSMTTDSSDGRPGWTIPVFFMLFIGVGCFALYWTKKTDHRFRGRYNYPGEDLEMQPRISGQMPHLSMLT